MAHDPPTSHHSEENEDLDEHVADAAAVTDTTSALDARPTRVESAGIAGPPLVEQSLDEHKITYQAAATHHIEESEVYFLIADFLKRRSVCHKAADVLIQELAEHELLKSSMDWSGRRRTATYDDYRLRHRDLSGGHLVELLQSTAATSCTRLGRLEEKQEKNVRVVQPKSSSLLVQRRRKRRVELSLDERTKLVKDIVRQLFVRRRVMRTLMIVEKVIQKDERYRKYTTTATRVDELPTQVQLMLLSGDAAEKAAVDKAKTVAADVRAFKQLFQLRQEHAAIEKEIDMLMDRAKHFGLLETIARTGCNQMSLVRRREVGSQQDTQLPPAHLYSRIRRLKTLSGHLQIQAYCLAYDKSSKVVITGSDDRLVKIWSLATGDLLFTLRGHVGNITDLAVNHSDTLVASSSDDKTVRVWEIGSGAPVAVLVGHSSVVNAVRFHPSKNIIVTASDDGRCFCYKVPEVPSVVQPETKIETARRLYSLNAYMLSLHPIYAMKHARREGVRSCKVHCVTFSRCGDYVVSGGHDGIARVWDLSVASAPNAPAVVPRFQPTDEPQEAQVQEQQRSGSEPRSGQVPSVFVGASRNQPLIAEPEGILTSSMQQVAIQDNDTTASAGPADPFRAMTSPRAHLALEQPQLRSQPQLQSRVPMQLQAGVAMPLINDIEILQRETTPRRPQPAPVQSDLPSLSLSDDAVPSIEPIALLQGLKGPVSSIVYSHQGDCIVTASIKDSAAWIWRWKRKYESVHGAVLLAKESSSEYDDISAVCGIRGRRKATPVVDMVAWTHNDKRLITLHSVKLNSESADLMWEQRIRVWHPESGKLLMTLGAVDEKKENGHVNAAFALSAHPTDWRILVTAGYDGRVFLWDISTGRMLKSFTNLSPDSKPLSNLDGGFTPSGNGFCFTDQIGRLLIFGTGSGEQYAATPVQQYFLHDYVMLVTDGHYNVRDRETRELPSLMDSGPLMDASLVQYPHQPPHLLPYKLASPEQHEENRRRRIQQSKESEILCGVRHQLELEEDVYSFPSAVVKCEDIDFIQRQEAFAAAATALGRSSYRLNGAPVTLADLRRRGSRRSADQRRRREIPAEERDTSVLEIEISSEDDRSDEDFQVPTRRHAAAEGEDDEDDEDEDESDLDDDDLLSENERAAISPISSRRGRLRSARQRELPRARFSFRSGRRLQSSNNEGYRDNTPRQLRARRNALRSRSRLVVDSDIEGDDDVSVDQRVSALGSGRDRSDHDDQDEVIVESTDGMVLGDNQLDRFDLIITYSQMLEAKRAQLGAVPVPPENGDAALLPCAFCGVGDDDAMLKLPGDGMGVYPLIYGAQRVFVHDQCAIASPLCFNRDGNWYNVAKEIRRGRSLVCVACNKRGATIGCTIAACRNSYHWKCAISFGWSVDQMQFFCPAHQPRRTEQEENNQPAIEDGGAVIEPASKRFGLRFHREWLQLTSLRSIHQYVPQVGDYVVYLPEGHPGYLHYGGMPHPRYYARLSRFYAIKCRVIDVKYVFPTAEEHTRCNTIKCELSLAVLAVPTSAARPAGQHEEQKQEEATTEAEVSDTTDLFHPESSLFAEFTSVDEQLSPIANEPSTRFTFKMLYHSNDVANFLVLDHTYESGVCGDWHIGDRVQMPFVQLDEHGLEIEAKMSYGTIENFLRKPFSSSNSAEVSPWDCVMVEWDDPDDDTCAVCPWELESALPEERREKRELSLRRRSMRLFFSRNIIADKCEALLQEVDQVLTLSISRDFMYPVDEETFMDYPISVANPIDLTKIQQRLRQGYYRQVEAYLADVKLVRINCETYNIPSSPISQNSRNLYFAVLTQAQRHFPHLSRGANNINRQEAVGEAVNTTYAYPPDDFVTNFTEESEETRLELLEIGLLTPVPEDDPSAPVATLSASRSSRSTSVESNQAEGSSDVATAAVADLAARDVSPETRPLRDTRSVGETEESDDAEETVDHVMQQDGETIVDNVSDEALPDTPNAADGAAAGFTSPRPLRNHEVIEPQLLSPRVRRPTRLVTSSLSGTLGGGGNARKRQRKTPVKVLLTHSALMDQYSSSEREAIKRACDEDLRAVLQVFHEALTEADKTDIFASPVTDDVAPHYSETVTRPMDFGTIQSKLHKYRSFRDYFAQVELVFSNAIKYNGWDCFIGGLVEDMQQYCTKFLLDAVGVNLQGHLAPATKKSRRSTDPAFNAGNKPSSAVAGKQRARRKPSAASSEYEEDSWHSSVSESEEDDDDDEIDEDDDDDDENEDFSDGSDYGGAGRKRQLRQRASGPKSKKKRTRRRC